MDMTPGIRAALAACTAALMTASGMAEANLLTNGSFEAVDASASPFYVRSFASTPGWTQIGDGVDLIHNDYEQPSLPVLVDASDGVQFLDMNQAGALGGIEQEVAAVVGGRYHLSLDSVAWATNSRGGTIGYALYDPASAGILASGTFIDTVGGTWNSLWLEAVATSSSIGVRIQGLFAAQAGMGVDNVDLKPVPVPAAFWLLGSALGGLGLGARRRG